MDLNALKQFILDASKATYASGNDELKEKQADGSTTIRYEEGAYSFHDNYFGGEPYGGREVVFLNNKPIWMMVYYGLVHNGVPAQTIYPFLMESLSQATIDMPYRGPSHYENGECRYENQLEGDVQHFSGTEKIYLNDLCVYEAAYIGGLVDQ
jgi:hypothetical protein